jgi:hypothetical protein
MNQKPVNFFFKIFFNQNNIILIFLKSIWVNTLESYPGLDLKTTIIIFIF